MQQDRVVPMNCIVFSHCAADDGQAGTGKAEPAVHLNNKTRSKRHRYGHVQKGLQCYNNTVVQFDGYTFVLSKSSGNPTIYLPHFLLSSCGSFLLLITRRWMWVLGKNKL